DLAHPSPRSPPPPGQPGIAPSTERRPRTPAPTPPPPPAGSSAAHRPDPSEATAPPTYRFWSLTPARSGTALQRRDAHHPIAARPTPPDAAPCPMRRGTRLSVTLPPPAVTPPLDPTTPA